MERSAGVCAPPGRRNFYGGRLDGSHPAQISPDRPGRQRSRPTRPSLPV